MRNCFQCRRGSFLSKVCWSTRPTFSGTQTNCSISATASLRIIWRNGPAKRPCFYGAPERPPEDAYTFAFLASEVLAQAGLNPYGFELLATDLSEACLNQAGTGQFQLQADFGSFRAIPEFAQHHF